MSTCGSSRPLSSGGGSSGSHTSGAESTTSSPRRRSEYCLTALKNLASEAGKEALRTSQSPELALVHRQVKDQLRKLGEEKTLLSHRLRTTKGRDICNLWGLPAWGEKWVRREPTADLEMTKESLPIIKSTQAGKGVFNYASTLPTYLPTTLQVHDSPLSTPQISSVVVSKISPPLIRNPNRASTGDYSGNHTMDGHFPGFTRTTSPEDVLLENEFKEGFLNSLTEREKQILELKEDGVPIDQIAEQLGCSKGTVHNDWKSIFAKCREAIAA